MTDNRRGYQHTHTHTHARRHRLPERLKHIYIYVYISMHVAVDCQLNTSGKTADKSDFQINIVYCIRDVLVRLYLFALRSLNPL